MAENALKLIKTEHKEKDPETKSIVEERVVETAKPDVLLAETLDDLVRSLGADMIYRKTMAQLIIDFRSHVRSLLAKKEGDYPNHQWTNSSDAIAAMDFSGWVPETQQRKSAEEKAAEQLGKLTPEQIEAALQLASARRAEQNGADQSKKKKKKAA